MKIRNCKPGLKTNEIKFQSMSFRCIKTKALFDIYTLYPIRSRITAQSEFNSFRFILYLR